jgi:hypothetical protein
MKKQEPGNLEALLEFAIDHFKIPTGTEIDGLIKKTEQSLVRLKMPTRKEFNQLIKRVEALEKAVKGRKQSTRKTARPVKASKKAVAKKRPSSRPRSQVTDSEKVLKVIRKYRAGTDVGTLKARTGFEDKKLRNIVFRLSKQGQIERTGRGVYKAKA